MEALAKAFPQDVVYDAPFDTTKFVSESINEVYKTLIEAGPARVVVILIFCRTGARCWCRRPTVR
jgi:HAE1 family hydrophobic/amphiphilic exporter-1